MKRLFIGRTRTVHVQFLRYLFVGGSSAILDLSIYTTLTEIFFVHYLIANLVAFAFGLSWNYLLGILWVFESKHQRAKEAAMVFAIAFMGLLWTELILWLLVEYGEIHHFVAKIVAIWVVLFWNFGMRKFYVFH